MPRALLAVVLLALLAVDGAPAAAAPGDRCRCARDCRAGYEYCLADDLASSAGRCVLGKVLP